MVNKSNKIGPVVVILIILAITVMLTTSGCQSKEYYEYYPPTAEYNVKGADGNIRGAIKKEYKKSGSNDWSDGKSFAVDVNGVGM